MHEDAVVRHRMPSTVGGNCFCASMRCKTRTYGASLLVNCQGSKPLLFWLSRRLRFQILCQVISSYCSQAFAHSTADSVLQALFELISQTVKSAHAHAKHVMSSQQGWGCWGMVAAAGALQSQCTAVGFCDAFHIPSVHSLWRMHAFVA